MLTTTANALLLVKAWEGFETQAYFDSVGVPTIGYGTTVYSNGDPVMPGDEITEDEAEAELFHHIRKEVEPVLNLHFENVPLQPNQRDALASFLYNLGGDASKWPTLKKLIAGQADSAEVADQWMKYHRAGGKPLLGLYRRRMAEVLVWLGIAWDTATDMVQTAKLDQDWRDFAPNVVSDPQVDAEIFDPPASNDPTPETPMTPDDHQYVGYVAAVGGKENAIPYADFMAHRTVVTARNAIEAPKVDTSKPPKPAEDSETVRGIAKKTSGRDDAWIGGAVAGVSTAMTTASGLSKQVSDITKNTSTIVGGATLHQLMVFGLIIGGFLFAYGLWKMFRGEEITKEGRQSATQLKV